MTKFEIGKTYYCRSACDHNCIWNVEVISRTEKTIKVLIEGKAKTLRPYIWNGIESALPLGRYSLAPVISADREAA